MTAVNRRRFLELGSLGAGLTAAVPGLAFGATHDTAAGAEDRRVRSSGDGLGLSPAEYARPAARVCSTRSAIDARLAIRSAASSRSSREALRRACSAKSGAIFMPTGTLANHLAVRALAGGSSRVIVQEDSHLYQDEGDCAQTLSNLTLMPLAAGRATFTRRRRCSACSTRRKGARVVSARVGDLRSRRRCAASRESASIRSRLEEDRRHRAPRRHPPAPRWRADVPRKPRYSGESVAETARRRSTPSTSSLYKLLQRRVGRDPGRTDAIVIDGMYPHAADVRRRPQSRVAVRARRAPLSRPASSDRYGRAVRVSEDLIRALAAARCASRSIACRSGTNLFRLRVQAASDPAAFQNAARRQRRARLSSAAARHVPGRRERNAESHDRAGADRRTFVRRSSPLRSAKA